MNEEQIIYYIKKDIEETSKQINNGEIMFIEDNEKIRIAVLEGLLNLYIKEKEKNRELQIFVDDVKEGVYIDYPEFEEKYISKDKIKEKIKDFDEKIKSPFLIDSYRDNYIFAKRTLERLLKGE